MHSQKSLQHRRSFLQLGAGTALTACFAASQGNGEEWANWRGASRDGWLHEQKIPRDFSKLTKVWSKDLADSYSGPVITNGKVFTTETIDKRDESLIALDANSGEEIWRRQWAGAMSVPFFAKANGDWIRSTPATDGKSIVVGGMRDVLACFDVDSGKENWRVDFVAEHDATLPSFGLVCSPIIEDGFVYVQAGGGVRKMELETGKTLWLSMAEEGGMMGGAFSSPIIAELQGKRQLITQTRSTLCGIDIDDGSVLWQHSIESFRGMNILTPTIWEDQVFTSCYGGKAHLLKPIAGPSSWQTEVVWNAKPEAYMSSPVVIDGFLYMHLKNKRVSCVDMSTGEETWRTQPFGGYWSMVTDGTSILALDESGELLLLNANPKEFELLERKKISEEPSWAHIALLDNQLFIRRQRGLDAYRWPA